MYLPEKSPFCQRYTQRIPQTGLFFVSAVRPDLFMLSQYIKERPSPSLDFSALCSVELVRSVNITK